MDEDPGLVTLAGGLLVIILVLASSIATPAVAQSDGGFVDGFVDDNDSGVVDSIMAFAAGLKDRVSYRISSFRDASEPDAAKDAEAVKSYFNNNSSDFVAYANNHSDSSDEWDTYEITFEREDSESTVFLVANHSNDSWDSAEIVNSTDRTPDKSITLSGYASDSARDELEAFHNDFVKTGDPVTGTYRQKMAGRYIGHVEASWLEGGD